MFRSTFQRRWVLFAVVFLAAAMSNAALVYTDRAAFPGLLTSGYYSSDFEDFDTGSQVPPTTTGDLAGTGNLSAGSAFHFEITTTDILYVLTGPSDYPRGRAMCTFNFENNLVINFTSGNVTAVGASFSLTDDQEDTATGTFDITLTFSTGGPQTLNNIGSAAGGGDPLFRGFTTDPGVFITSLTFHPDSGYATLDDLTVGVIPELPSTGIAAALLCLLVAGRVVVRGVCSKLRSQIL